MAAVVLASALGAAPVGASDRNTSADICVYGGSEAGFAAAVQAARMGKSVVLIEPTGHAGGMLVEGLCGDVRFGNQAVIGGIAAEFYRRVDAHYGRKSRFGQSKNWRPAYEPHVAEAVIDKMLSEAKVRVIRGWRIKYGSLGVVKKGARLESVFLEPTPWVAARSPEAKEIDGPVVLRLPARMFIDASIEGDLLHAAGVSTTWGREGNAKYGETKNGIRTDTTYRQFAVAVDPYKRPGDPASGVIATIQDEPLGEHGAGDKSVMGYCFRLCMTKDPANRLKIEKPKDYDPAAYEIYRRYLAAGGQLFSPGGRANVPRGKTDIGSWHDLSANLYGMNHDYPAGDYETRRRIYLLHKSFTHGLIWFLQNDPAVPERTKKQWREWGMCKDEFTDNGGWPRRVYVRSARRMVSDYVITEHHTRKDNPRRVADPVGVAFWPPDMHHARRIVRDGRAWNEGFVFGGNDWRPFGVSYRALAPRASECENLLTPTCPSSSYVAYGAIRLVWTFMVLGQSAGAAAAIALDQNCRVQDVKYDVLRRRLLADGQVLAVPELPGAAAAPPKPQRGGQGIVYSQLPPGAAFSPFKVGVGRCADRFELVRIPDELAGLDVLTVPRGAGLTQPGAAWSFTLEKPAKVFLLVMDRGEPAPEGWERTELAVTWRSGEKTFTDTVFVREFPAGKVEIPAHRWRDKEGAHGVPHACVVRRRGD